MRRRQKCLIPGSQCSTNSSGSPTGIAPSSSRRAIQTIGWWPSANIAWSKRCCTNSVSSGKTTLAVFRQGATSSRSNKAHSCGSSKPTTTGKKQDRLARTRTWFTNRQTSGRARSLAGGTTAATRAPRLIQEYGNWSINRPLTLMKYWMVRLLSIKLAMIMKSDPYFFDSQCLIEFFYNKISVPWCRSIFKNINWNGAQVKEISMWLIEFKWIKFIHPLWIF